MQKTTEEQFNKNLDYENKIKEQQKTIEKISAENKELTSDLANAYFEMDMIWEKYNLMKELFETSNNVKLCMGCREEQPNQEAHMGLHGCLSEEDEILSNLRKKRRF
jgi:predicted RNase H-like nuclease (RuvC/YqgF family)